MYVLLYYSFFLYNSLFNKLREIIYIIILISKYVAKCDLTNASNVEKCTHRFAFFSLFAFHPRIALSTDKNRIRQNIYEIREIVLKRDVTGNLRTGGPGRPGGPIRPGGPMSP